MSNKNIRTYSLDANLVKERREHIIRCVTPLFIKHGYTKTTTRQITEACNMSWGALYHYVGSKKDILYLVLENITLAYKRLFENLENSGDNISSTDMLREYIRQFFQQMDRYQDWVVYANREMATLSKDDQRYLMDSEIDIIKSFERLLIKGVKTGEFKIKDPLLIAQTITMIGNTWAIRRWFLSKRWKLEDYINEHTENIINLITTKETESVKL